MKRPFTAIVSMICLITSCLMSSTLSARERSWLCQLPVQGVIVGSNALFYGGLGAIGSYAISGSEVEEQTQDEVGNYVIGGAALGSGLSFLGYLVFDSLLKGLERDSEISIPNILMEALFWFLSPGFMTLGFIENMCSH